MSSSHLSLLGLFFVTMVACSSPTTPRRRRIMSSTMILLSSLSYYYSPYFQCDAFKITTTSNRQGIAATRRRRSSTPMFVDSTTDINGGIATNGSEEGVASVDAALFGLVVDDASKVTSTLVNTVVEEARELLAMENEILGPDGAPIAPMMTYQKYVTMQEKRVKVTVRYTAEAGLRPFYLTVANRIKLAHPDVLLEKRILPRAGGDGPSGETVFEVIIDGKTIIGKKKTKLLKVSSRMSSSRSSSVGDDDEGGGSSIIMESGDKKKKDGSGGKRKEYGDGGSRAIPDVAAGGRTIFVSMEKLDQELVKARKKRRPNTAYKTKEDVIRGTTGSATIGGIPLTMLGGTAEDVDVALRMAAEDEMKEAVIRLERLKAMSTRSKI